MRPALLLLALVSLPLALAAPLLGSLGSVAEGGYCRAYGCTLVERQAIAPDLLDKVAHTYALRGGGSLLVIRDHDRRIEAATLTGRPFDGQAARDFTRTFAGLSFEPATLRSCARRATAEGVVVASGRTSSTAYAVRCYTHAGHLYLSVERP